MIIKALYSYYIRENKAEKIENNEFLSDEGEVYEVIRIIGGIPLFLEDHTGRFYNSISLAGLTATFKAAEIETRLNLLISVNQVFQGNIRFSVQKEFRAFFIPYKYPGEMDYREGIRCGLLNRERQNPEAKTTQEKVRGIADRLLGKTDLYEVLLVNNNNHITEGSRSNVFFIKDNCFYTPPAPDVLPGTTRKRIISLIRQLGLPLFETNINLAGLGEFEAAFITGTSPKVLPIREIDSFSYRIDHTLMRKLMKKYDEMVADYLRRRE